MDKLIIKLFGKTNWLKRQEKKAPRYYCLNCDHLFRTGKFSRFDSHYFDDVCPNCGGLGSDFTELAEAYKDLLGIVEKSKKKDKKVSQRG